MVQNYRYLNGWTIKKQLFFAFDFRYYRKYWYKKVFTKLDLCWRYNNIQIKEGNK